jgi:SNF2 family DNA or RNA helicase
VTKTFGRCVLEKRRWFLTLEPHVAMRAKRVFTGLLKDSETGTLSIPDTVSNCRDILWFLERYPLEIDPGRLERLRTRSQEQLARENLVADVLAGCAPALSFDLARPARDYQRESAELALAGRGLLDGSELGVGKTVTGIAMLTDPRTRPALVVCPTHLQRQWAEKFAEFAPQLTTHVLKRGTPYDYVTKRQRKGLKLPVESAHPDVLITSYAKLVGWAETLAGVVKSVIYDEVHELRSGPLRGNGENLKGSAKCTAAQQISNAALFRLGLSGTPIFNYGGEIYWVLQALKPWEFGTAEEFRREWCAGGGDKARLEDPEAFGSFLRAQGFMVRKTRKEVAREIPRLTKATEFVDADPDQLDALTSSATELARIILNQAGRDLAKGEQFRAAGEFDWKIRQATGIAKAPHVATYVKMMLESEPKILLAGWHRAVFDVWLDQLKEFNPVLFTGTESDRQKDGAKKAFCEGDSRVMIMSLRSGAGLDGLQYSGCKTVVFGELDWAYAVHEQLTGRIHRDGQPEPVLALYLVSDSGSDPVVMDVLGIKREQLDGIRNPFGETAEAVEDTTRERIKRLAEELLRKRAA